MRNAWALLLFLLSVQSSAAIYGNDDRLDIIHFPRVEPLAKAVATQVSNYLIAQPQNGVYLNTSSKSLQEMGLCSNEKFAHQPSLGMCTGFLVAPRLLVTAGHCSGNYGINGAIKQSCEAFSWYFGYRLNARGHVNVEELPEENVYKCRRVLHAETWENYPYTRDKVGIQPDFAVIELDRDVVGVEPLRIASTPVKKDDMVFAIGHPWGLPAKYSGRSAVTGTEYVQIFSALIDSQGGNSGGPVFNEQHEVVGILTAGYQFDSYRTQKSCEAWTRCSADGLKCSVPSQLFEATEVQKIEAVLPYLAPSS